MGSLLKDKKKDILVKRTTAQPKANRSWQLLFVDDKGKIVSFAWFKSTAIVILGALLLSIVCSITLSVFFIKSHNENTVLKEGLEASESRLKALQNEKDILLARLVLLESKIETASDEKPVSEQVTAEVEKNIKPDDSAGKKVSSKETVPERKDPVEQDSLKIAVKDFSASYEPDSNHELKIQFVIKNSSQSVKTVKGYIFVVLKPDGSNYKEWVTIPSAEFAEGKPVEAIKGKFFRISRFKTIFFRMNKQISPEKYKTATVFVFNRDGIKQFEKSFPLMLETIPSKNSRKKISLNRTQAAIKETDSVKPVEKKSQILPMKVKDNAEKTTIRGKSSPETHQPEISPQKATPKTGAAKEETG